eukprot:gene1447-12066_t
MTSILIFGLAVSTIPLLLKKTKKILIIGDVHGCLDEFKELIEKAEKTEQIEEIYQVGDLVNKGPKSLEVIDYVMKKNIKCIIGNHDDLAISAFEKKLDYSLDWTEKMTESQYNYLKSLPLFRKIPEYNLLLVHAGVEETKSIEEQSKKNLISMRDVKENGEATSVRGEGEAWASKYKGSLGFVIFGHDAVRELQIEPFAIGLDTGCLYGKKLTGIIYPEKKIIQIQAKKMYKEPK